MPNYTYRAKNRAGATVTGNVEADTESMAAAMIREMGHLPLEIRATGGAVRANPESGSALVRYLVYPLWTGVNMRHLVFFYRQLGTLLASGMSLSEALHSLSTRVSGRFGRLIAEMLLQAQQGGRMSDVMERHPRVFSQLQVSLIRVGESGGMLEQMIDRIAGYLEYELSVRRMIARQMLYPILILIFAFSAHIGIPHIGTLVDGNVGDFAKACWPQVRGVLFGAVIAVVVLKLLFQFDTAKLMWDSAKVVPPVIGTTARKIAMSRFSRALAVLYAAGMGMPESVAIAADACGNLAIGQGIKRAVPALRVGQGLTETLTKTGAVTPIVLDMLATGERTGSMDAVLDKVAEYMDDEADNTIQKLGTALLVLMILIAGAVVGYVVVTFYQQAVGTVMQQADQ